MHQNFHSTQTWTIRGRYETVTTPNQPGSFPGPSDYFNNKVTPKAPTFKMPRAKRQIFDATVKNPGPGSYSPNSSLFDGPKRSFTSRPEPPVKKSPGPQDYQPDGLKVKKTEPKYSIKPRSKSLQDLIREKASTQPGPNKYTIPGSFNKPRGVIGRSQRRDLTETQRTPGPGTYLSLDKLDKSEILKGRNNPRFSFGTSPRKNDAVENSAKIPGPGAYKLPDFASDNIASHKGYTMRPQTTDLDALSRSKLPGPGQYNTPLSNKKRSPSYSCGSGNRFAFDDDKERLKIPGPGTHDPNASDFKSKTGSSWKFSVSPRKSLYEYETTPGPGAYEEQKWAVMPAAPRFAASKSPIGADNYLELKKASPGPSQYDPKYHLVWEAFRRPFTPGQSQRPSFEKHRFLPGPGQYRIFQGRRSPEWKFGSQTKPAFAELKSHEVTPGPPDYQIKATVPNPPEYMRVFDKLRFRPHRTSFS